MRSRKKAKEQKTEKLVTQNIKNKRPSSIKYSIEMNTRMDTTENVNQKNIKKNLSRIQREKKRIIELKWQIQMSKKILLKKKKLNYHFEK